jgi:hypothetical protein
MSNGNFIQVWNAIDVCLALVGESTVDIVKFHAFHAFHDTNTNTGTTRGGAAAPHHSRAFDSIRRTEPDRRPSVSSRRPPVSSLRTVLRLSRATNKRSTPRTDASAAGADDDAVSDGGRGGRGGRRVRSSTAVQHSLAFLPSPSFMLNQTMHQLTGFTGALSIENAK